MWGLGLKVSDLWVSGSGELVYTVAKTFKSNRVTAFSYGILGMSVHLKPSGLDFVRDWLAWRGGGGVPFGGLANLSEVTWPLTKYGPLTSVHSLKPKP